MLELWRSRADLNMMYEVKYNMMFRSLRGVI
jgi:hypothetical protein